MADNNDKDVEYDASRRKFIKNSGIAIGGVAGGALIGGLITNQFQSDKTVTPEKADIKDNYTEARMFFTRFEDFVVLEQATERIFPSDENGPGAIELGVPYFIDKQMAGTYGMNDKEYRNGPFLIADPSVAQSSLTRGQIMLAGIRKINQVSRERFDTTFNETSEEQQLEILQDFASSKVTMAGVNASGFFSFLRSLTIEGVYCDPLYGGNRNMAGWKMKEYPGALPSYANVIESEEFMKGDPSSLADYQQKS